MVSCLAACLLALPGSDEPMAEKPVPRRAQRAYRRGWKRFDDLYGAEGQPAPLLHLKSKAEHREDPYPLAAVGRDVSGVLNVHLAPTHARTLRMMGRGKPPRSVRNAPKWAKRDARWTWQKRRKDMLTTLLHEWAHVYQDTREMGRQLPPPLGSHIEGAAQLFAHDAAKDRIKGYKKRGGGRRPYNPNAGSMYKLQMDALKELEAPEFWMRGQFGENYGKNPRDIR